MLNRKKSQIPLIKTILIILITAIILITFIITLSSMNNISIDNKKINTQITINKILNSKCFSDKFATIDSKLFSQSNFNQCFTGINDEILVRIKIENGESFYLNEKETLFKQKVNFCSTNTNLLCTQMVYPIIYKRNNEKEIKKLIIQTII